MSVKVAVIYYSATGAVHQLAQAVAEGAEKVGAEVRLRRVPELAPDAAIDANPRARKTFATLGRQNLFALAFRTNNMKTPAGRQKKIADLVAMLARGETIVPEPRRATNKPRR